MKICFVTDLHIDTDGLMPLGLDTRAHFRQVLGDIKEKSFDLLVLGGDLCHRTGDEGIYGWILQQLGDLKMPFLSISGNHDTSLLLAKSFGWEEKLHGDELYYTHTIGASKFIFLDTSQSVMSDHQWSWFTSEIMDQGPNIYIFMHHPPVISGSKHMEPKYLFTQTERFEALCNSFIEKHFYIFTGHYHIEKSIMKANISVFITPSTFVQIDPESVEFKPVYDNIGYRELEIDGPKISTRVVYI